MNLVNKARKRIARIKYKVTETGCYLPINLSLKRDGRIATTFNSRQIALPRLVAFAYHDLDINDISILACHVRECPNKHCINKDHIYKGSSSDNSKDVVATKRHKESKRIYCKNGHLLSGMVYRSDGSKERCCITCRNERQRIRRLSS